MHRLAIALVSCFFILSVLAVEPQQSSVKEYQLSNGLKLIVKPVDRSSVVTNLICYRVGSSYESEGATGIAHALEHMMFKSTTHYATGVFSRMVASRGGTENAYTNYDYTCYFQQLDAQYLPMLFELEADRMHNLLFKPEEWAKEKQVIMEERRMRITDNPQALAYERFLAAAHLRFGYHHPIIGWMEDLQGLSLAQLKQWYRDWYAPNHAVIVVVGRVEPTKVLRLAHQYFGAIPPAPTSPSAPPLSDITPLAERIVKLRLFAVRIPYLVMGFNTPSLVTTMAEKKNYFEPYALEILAAVLGGSDSARLDKELVRNQAIASEVDVDYDLYSRLPGLFTIDAIPAAKHTIDEVRQAIHTQLVKVQQQLISPEELQRVKMQLIAKKTYARDASFNQALQIGMLESVGLSWRDEQAYVDRITAITPQQIQATAKKYFIFERTTIAELEPLR